MGDNRYEFIYNVGLLDDVHNYFPALLYDSGRFRSITEVFHYIRYQMNTRFNLFSYGASRYADAQEDTRNPMPTVILTPQARPVPVPRATTSDIFTNLQATNLLLSMMGLGETQRTSFRDIVVRPTSEQIEAASEILAGETLPEETRCAICQDILRTGETCRRLRHCSHAYHQTCIDQWFLRSVFCPTCRHDIRERAPGA